MNIGHTVVVTFKAKPDQRQELLLRLMSVEKELPNVVGCIGAHAIAHSDDNECFTLVEFWQNVNTHTEHVNKLVANGAWAALMCLLSEEPHVKTGMPLQ